MIIYVVPGKKGFLDDRYNEIPADARPIENEMHMALLQGQSQGLRINWDSYPPTLVNYAQPVLSATQLAAEIDQRVADIYTNWTRFEAEYYFREKAAQAFKDAGYVGDPGVWVTSFAVAADLGNKAATDKILQQAAALRKAQENLGALRMRKYELYGADQITLDLKYTAIMAEINQVAKDLV